jgi:hypothetical protein
MRDEMKAFDIAEYIDGDATAAEYLSAAAEDRSPAVMAAAEKNVERAKEIRRKTTARPSQSEAGTPMQSTAAPKEAAKAAKGESRSSKRAVREAAPPTNSIPAQAGSGVQWSGDSLGRRGPAHHSPQGDGEVQTAIESHSLGGLPEQSTHAPKKRAAVRIIDGAKEAIAISRVQQVPRKRGSRVHSCDGSQDFLGPAHSSPLGGGAAHVLPESQSIRGRADISALCTNLQELQVQRRFYISLVNKITNAAGARVRRVLGFDPTADEKANAKIKTRAASILSKALSGKPQASDDEDIATALHTDLVALNLALAPLQQRRDDIEKQMVAFAKQLPAYAFAKGVKGFGDLAFAVVVGESGDLNGERYTAGQGLGVRRLWKRLGLAPFEGEAMSSWRKGGGLTAEQWTDAGYNPHRLAEVFSAISDPLSKHQLESAEKSGTDYGRPKGPYGEVYVRRREHTAVTHSDWTKAHARNDALRLMTKSLVADLLQAWRGSTTSAAEKPIDGSASADFLEAAE